MEIRKLQVTGGSTHVVSLPKKWIDRNRLKRSDSVAIHEEPDGSLLLIPHGEAKTGGRSITVELPDSPTQADIARRLVGAYLAGADEIRVKMAGRFDPAIRAKVRDLSRSLVGVEILDEGAQGLTLQDLVGVAEMDLRKSLTRMQRLARLMFDDAVKALEMADAELGLDVARRDDELDRLLWMVSKQMHALLEQPRLAANLDVRPAEALNLFMAARALERIGDHAAKLGANVAALKGFKVPTAVTTSLVEQAEVVRKLWDDAFASLKRPDFDLASRAADLGEDAAAWRLRFPTNVAHLGPEAVGPLTLIADSLDRTRGYAIDIAEMAMNQTFQQMV